MKIILLILFLLFIPSALGLNNTSIPVNHAKITTNADVDNYFWEILFLAVGLYIGTFFLTMGDKK